MREKTFTEWNREGLELFGKVRANWRFICPRCGHVQTAADFFRFKAHGARPESAATECFGRYSDERGCNWSSYGPRRGPVMLNKSGQMIPIFDFYRKGSKITETYGKDSVASGTYRRGSMNHRIKQDEAS